MHFSKKGFGFLTFDFAARVFYGEPMERHEFESALKDFEAKVKKKLPSFINVYLINRGNREQEAAFTHLVETLNRQRKNLLKYLAQIAKQDQKIRFFNSVYSMDSQLRSMGNRDARRQQLKLRQHRIHAPVVYDVGEGPIDGDILNFEGDGLLIKTTEKVSLDHEVKISVGEKKARGKTVWSIPEVDGSVETGVKMTELPDDFLGELKELLKERNKKG